MIHNLINLQITVKQALALAAVLRVATDDKLEAEGIFKEYRDQLPTVFDTLDTGLTDLIGDSWPGATTAPSVLAEEFEEGDDVEDAVSFALLDIEDDVDALDFALAHNWDHGV